MHDPNTATAKTMEPHSTASTSTWSSRKSDADRLAQFTSPWTSMAKNM